MSQIPRRLLSTLQHFTQTQAIGTLPDSPCHLIVWLRVPNLHQISTTAFNTIHYKALRKIFSIKSSFFHRVLSPTDEQCSNEYLLKLSYEHLPKLQPPSQHIQSARIAYLGHLLRHEAQLEHHFCFNASHNYIQFPQRRVGAPRIHWAELAMTEAYTRQQYLLQNRVPPRVYEHSHAFYTQPSRQDIAALHSHWFGNTDLIRALQPLSQDRSQWRQLMHPR